MTSRFTISHPLWFTRSLHGTGSLVVWMALAGATVACGNNDDDAGDDDSATTDTAPSVEVTTCSSIEDAADNTECQLFVPQIPALETSLTLKSEAIDEPGDRDFYAVQLYGDQPYLIWADTGASQSCDLVLRFYDFPTLDGTSTLSELTTDLSREIGETDDMPYRYLESDPGALLVPTTDGPFVIEVLEYNDWAGSPSVGGSFCTYTLRAMPRDDTENETGGNDYCTAYLSIIDSGAVTDASEITARGTLTETCIDDPTEPPISEFPNQELLEQPFSSLPYATRNQGFEFAGTISDNEDRDFWRFEFGEFDDIPDGGLFWLFGAWPTLSDDTLASPTLVLYDEHLNRLAQTNHADSDSVFDESNAAYPTDAVGFVEDPGLLYPVEENTVYFLEVRSERTPEDIDTRNTTCITGSQVDVDDVIISEVFAFPDSTGSCSSTDTEYVELYNATSSILEVTGLTLTDDNANELTFGKQPDDEPDGDDDDGISDAEANAFSSAWIHVDPGERFVAYQLPDDGDPESRCFDIPLDGSIAQQGYDYGGFSLDPDDDGITLTNPSSAIILDSIDWITGFFTEGHSEELRTLSLDPDLNDNTDADTDDSVWCPSQAELIDDADAIVAYGTPGLSAQCSEDDDTGDKDTGEEAEDAEVESTYYAITGHGYSQALVACADEISSGVEDSSDWLDAEHMILNPSSDQYGVAGDNDTISDAQQLRFCQASDTEFFWTRLAGQIGINGTEKPYRQPDIEEYEELGSPRELQLVGCCRADGTCFDRDVYVIRDDSLPTISSTEGRELASLYLSVTVQARTVGSLFTPEVFIFATGSPTFSDDSLKARLADVDSNDSSDAVLIARSALDDPDPTAQLVLPGDTTQVYIIVQPKNLEADEETAAGNNYFMRVTLETVPDELDSVRSGPRKGPIELVPEPLMEPPLVQAVEL